MRLDPAGEPGALPSAHVHHIVGGNAFNATMEGDVAQRATCTTCVMAEDFSNYWVAQLYFKDPKNGTYTPVSVSPINPAIFAEERGAIGGLTVYYTQYDLSRDNLAQQKIKSFQPGFRMTVGNPAAKEKVSVGLTYQCLQGGNRGREMDNFPTTKCSGGLFTSHHFPACWNGKDLDSPDHQSHMYFSKRQNGFIVDPKCPDSHPVRMPQVAFEVTWNTQKFANLWDPAKDANPFTWSFGGSGFGTHADYLFGWKGDALQKAMDKSECFYDGCGTLKKTPMAQGPNNCKIKDIVGEDVGLNGGWLSSLPGKAMPHTT
jgi:hypothetical protein